MDTISSAAEDIRKIAIYNPKLAFMLTRGQPLSQRFYTVTIQFDSVAVNETIRDNMLNEPMYQFFWVKYMLYTIRRPQFNEGVFGRFEQDEYCKLNPYVDVDCRLVGRERYRLTNGMTPLENVASPASAPNPKALDWVMTEDSNIAIDATLTRSLSSEGETPYVVDITLVGLELSGCKLPGCGWDEIVCTLRNEGWYPQPSASGYTEKK